MSTASGAFRNYIQISTAYVAGTHTRAAFRERTRRRTRASATPTSSPSSRPSGWCRKRDDFATMIVRPSIVVGDRRSGWTSAFNVLYWPLRAFARGMYRRCLRFPALLSTSCPSTTWPMPSMSSVAPRTGAARPTISPPVRTQAAWPSSSSWPAATSSGHPLGCCRRWNSPNTPRRSRASSVGAGTERHLLSLLRGRHRSSTTRGAGAARAGRDPDVTAGCLPGAAARFRDSQPLGQTTDRPGGSPDALNGYGAAGSG